MTAAKNLESIGYQPHIQGLRAVAVIAVVAHHVGLLDRGFLGVDAFFVISGFLISSIIFEEIDNLNTVRLVHFYGRRARRILPMAALVIGVSLMLVVFLGNSVQTVRVALEGVWASLFVANVHYLNLSTDYFANTDLPVLRHYWSLAVEEQFYIVWPVLFLIIAKVAKRAWKPAVLITTTFITVTSFIYAVYAGHQNPTGAYFLTTGRAWQLGIGAFCAALLFYIKPKPISNWVTYALTFCLLASFIYPVNSFVPALQAAPVVTLTVLVIYFGLNGKNVILSNIFMQRIGDRSFGFYLWHWPMIVITGLYFDSELTTLQLVSIVIAAYALSEITYRYFENPIRKNQRLIAKPFAAIRIGGAFIVTSLIFSLAINASQANFANVQPIKTTSTETLEESPAESSSPTASASPFPTPSTSNSPSPKPQKTPDPNENTLKVQELVGSLQGSSFAALFGNLQEVIQGGISADEFPTTMKPRLGDIVRDRSEWFENGCSVDFADVNVPECKGGNIGSNKKIVLYGDSHATMWMPAFDRIGKELGWEIHLFAKLACPLVEENVWSYQLNKPFFECQTWQKEVLGKIENLNPDVIVATDQWKPAVKNGSKDDNGVIALWQNEFQPAMAKLKSYTNKLIVLGNVPNIESDPATCLGQAGSAPWQCSTLRDDAEFKEINKIEKKATLAVGGSYISTMEWACTIQFCPTVIGGRVAYFDQWHFSDTYVKWLDPVLKAALGL